MNGRSAPDAPAPERRNWWRRNRGALLALALLLPTSAGVIGVQEWRTNNTEVTVPADTVPAGESIRTEGAVIGPVVLADAEGAEVPPGARAVAATFPVALESGPITCGVSALRETDGERRRWNTGASVTGWSPPPDSWTTCPSEPDGSDVVVSVVFVVPAGAGPFVLDLLVGSESRLLRFELD